jgi:sarcosine oxidase subunit beta
MTGPAPSLPASADVVILGAGVMGASIAFQLAQRRPGRIVLLDKDHAGEGASGRSSALIRMHYTFAPEVELAQEPHPAGQRTGERANGHGQGLSESGAAHLEMPEAGRHMVRPRAPRRAAGREPAR